MKAPLLRGLFCMIRRFAVYILVSGIILSWWLLSLSTPKETSVVKETSLSVKDVPLEFSLQEITKEELSQALQGDVDVILDLLLRWHSEALFLQHNGVGGVQKLSSQEIERALLLFQMIKNEADNQDMFLPQTYQAADFLLALVGPDHIVAIPEGMRNFSYCSQLSSKIYCDNNRYNSEEIFCRKPQKAFISRYSHPALLETLQGQGIQLFFVDDVSCIDDIYDRIGTVGDAVNRPCKGEMLALFARAAMLAIDNHWLLIRPETEWSFLFLDFYAQYVALTDNHLAAQLLQRLGGYNILNENLGSDWYRPMTQEDIVVARPDYCFVIGDPLKKRLERLNPGGGIIVVDNECMSSLSQYIVLAYWQLFEELKR